MKPAFHPITRLAILVVQVAWAMAALANPGVTLQIDGLNAEMSQNVQAHIHSNWTLNPRLDTERRRQAFLNDVKRRASQALRPWGHYTAIIQARLERSGDDEWLLRLDFQPGEPVRVTDASIRVSGPGAAEAAFEQWRREWPLGAGAVLNQLTWELEKSRVLDLAQATGYLQAEFSRHRIALDLERNQADLELHFETGPRAVMGEIHYQQDVVDPEILAPISRFRPGDPYRADRIEEFRLDLWKTGYFSEIEVTEQRREGEGPMIVDLHARLTPRHRSTHQVTLGYGTDTQIRTQYNWTRHRLSSRGDSLSAAAGWRQRYSEILASTEYRLPRKTDSMQFWVFNGALRRENQDFVIQADNSNERIPIASGEVLDMQGKAGRLRLINTPLSSDRIAETMFVALLWETDHLQAAGPVARDSGDRDVIEDLLGKTRQHLSIGMEWDWPVIRGRGFNTTGFRHRAWWLTANTAWGSNNDFSQVYLASRWNHLLGERWKLLLRGEIGYSDARVREFVVRPEDPVTVSVTDLPYRYSFRAGGGHSVRGYEFERLSSNGVGSNHLLVASAELEYRLLNDWSIAGFYDIGNAFNNWGQAELKRGWGLGLRWYSIIGSVRADFGRAEDIEGKPWEFYLTIGTPLL